MKLRERIDEIQRMKGVCLQVESDVTEYIVKPYALLDKETLSKGVKVEIFAMYHFFDINVGNKCTSHERMDDAEAAIAEMKAYQEYFENEDYQTKKIEENGIVGFYVIL